jgi:hypothetical protein
VEITSKQHRYTQFALVAAALVATIAGAIEIQSNSPADETSTAMLDHPIRSVTPHDAFTAFAPVNAADPPTLISRHQAYREARQIMGIDEGKALVAAATAGQ